MEFSYRRKILTVLAKRGNFGHNKTTLFKECACKKPSKQKFETALKELIEDGEVIQKSGNFIHAEKLGLIPAKIVKLQKTFGFARQLKDDAKIFIVGKYLKGALPGDVVLISYTDQRGESLEGEVYKVIKPGSSQVTGIISVVDGQVCVVPDEFSSYALPVIEDGGILPKSGEKVIAEVVVRGDRHSMHKVKVISVFGDSERAVSCAEAILQLNGISLEFPKEVLEQVQTLTQKGVTEKDIEYRIDLRNDMVFTIDGADSKDLDDAVSIEKTDKCYLLNVSIADVSHYVKSGSVIDKEAYERGTSIYYANKVVPMLPKELSNGICSLNPNEDRLAFTAFMEISFEGDLVSYHFKKSVIRSKVKGVYTEINDILDDSATREIQEKYQEVIDRIFIMKELADILTQKKRQRGAPEIETTESKILIDEEDNVIDVLPSERGKSEVIIEEFMLLANQAAAATAKEQQLPFVYRVHEYPSEMKLQSLRENLANLGFDTKSLQADVHPRDFANFLSKAKGTTLYPVVNMQILRSMAKAKYSDEPMGHFGLVLGDYAHFTSPIRRYPDLAIHRILNDFAYGNSEKNIHKKFGKVVSDIGVQSTQTELNAVMIERNCVDCYKAEYMKKHIGQQFDGVIVGIASHGIYVRIPNTVEGLLKTEDLPEGEYMMNGAIEVREVNSNTIYRVGDPIKVVCSGVNVNAGNIDFGVATAE